MSGASTLTEAAVLPAPPPSFEAIFTACTPFVWRSVRRLGVREADVEDVCQEVFLIVHRRLATYNAQSTVRTWVYGIVVRVAADYRRKAHHKREQAMAELPERAVPAAQHAELEKRRALAWLDGVLDALDDDQRMVFVLYEIEHLPMAEIATAAACPLQTAYGRLYTARKHVEAAAVREQAKRSRT